MPEIDAIDARIVELLQENGRISQHDLARDVGLSAPAVSDRLRKLEERGVVRGFTALVDPKRLGLDITAFVSVGIAGSRYYGEFRARAADLAEIQECHSVTGGGSHLLKIRVANTAALEGLLAHVQAWPGVQWTSTSLVLSTTKETPALPVPRPDEEGAGRDDELGPSDLLHVPFRHQP